MSEWWTYSPQDFLLFSPRTYYRLLEIHNAALWPGHLLAIALGGALPVLLRSGWSHRGRAVTLILAACWLWVAWSFFQRYAAINWAAQWFAGLFVAEAVLLVLVGFAGNDFGSPWHRREIVVFAVALLAQPLAGLVAGRPPLQAEIFAVAPDPTAIATLGALMPSPSRARWLLMPIPVIWCVVSGATLWAMSAPDAALPPVAAAVAVIFAVRR